MLYMMYELIMSVYLHIRGHVITITQPHPLPHYVPYKVQASSIHTVLSDIALLQFSVT